MRQPFSVENGNCTSGTLHTYTRTYIHMHKCTQYASVRKICIKISQVHILLLYLFSRVYNHPSPIKFPVFSAVIFTEDVDFFYSLNYLFNQSNCRSFCRFVVEFLLNYWFLFEFGSYILMLLHLLCGNYTYYYKVFLIE